MKKVQLQIIMRFGVGGEEITENIGYVNPDATDQQLYQLAVKLCRLTSNTFQNVNKIVTTSIEGDDD